MNKLDNITVIREVFDPKKKYHMTMARDFFRDHRWGQLGCPFVLEWPYEDIPYMLKTKIAEHFLKVENA